MKSSSEMGALHEVSSRDVPDVAGVITHLQERVSEVGGWLGDAQRMEELMLCLWEGQSADYRKWDKNHVRPVAPFDGAADTRVRFVDAAVQDLVMLEMTAFFAAQPQAIQMGAEDGRTAGKVALLLKYEIQQRMAGELWREFNLLGSWKHVFGMAVMRVGYTQPWTTGAGVVRREELLAWMLERRAVDGGDAVLNEAVLDEAAMVGLAGVMEGADAEAEVLKFVSERFPLLSEKRARRVARELMVKEVVEFRLPVKKAGRPVVKAYCPGVDIFFDWWLDDPRRGDVVHVIDAYTETELRAMRLQDGWDEGFIDAMVRMGPTPVVDEAAMLRLGRVHTEGRRLAESMSAVGKTLANRAEQLLKKYQVLRSYVRSVDEDGVPQLHEVICHPALSKGGDGEVLVAVNRLVDYYDDSGSCFVPFRREYRSRPMWECRGGPELLGGTQWELKKMRDNRINRSDLATNPPVRTSLVKAPGRATQLGIAPGHLVIDGQRHPTSYMEPPRYDADTGAMAEELRRDAAELMGLWHKDVLPAKLDMHQQWVVNNFLLCARDVVMLILSMDQQFMDPLMVARVVGGSGGEVLRVTREEIAGQFDVVLRFDVRSLNMDYIVGRWGVIEKAYANDRSGVMNDEVITRWLLNSVDPNLADLAVGDARQVQEDEVNEEKRELALASTKVVIPPERVRNPLARLQAIQEVMSGNPVLGALYQQDEGYRAIVDSRAKKYEFDLAQRENAKIGREGYQEPELPESEEVLV